MADKSYLHVSQLVLFGLEGLARSFPQVLSPKTETTISTSQKPYKKLLGQTGSELKPIPNFDKGAKSLQIY